PRWATICGPSNSAAPSRRLPRRRCLGRHSEESVCHFPQPAARSPRYRSTVDSKPRGHMPVSTRVRRTVVRSVLLFLTGVTAAGQAPRVDPYLPKPTGLGDGDLASLEVDLDRLGAEVRQLTSKYPSGAMHDRVADVDVF